MNEETSRADIPCAVCGVRSEGVSFIRNVLRPVCNKHNTLFKRPEEGVLMYMNRHMKRYLSRQKVKA